jgi:hypothetical protein
VTGQALCSQNGWLGYTSPSLNDRRSEMRYNILLGRADTKVHMRDCIGIAGMKVNMREWQSINSIQVHLLTRMIEMEGQDISFHFETLGRDNL